MVHTDKKSWTTLLPAFQISFHSFFVEGQPESSVYASCHGQFRVILFKPERLRPPFRPVQRVCRGLWQWGRGWGWIHKPYTTWLRRPKKLFIYARKVLVPLTNFAVAISCHLKKIPFRHNGLKAGHFQAEFFWAAGDVLFKWPEIASALTFCPNFQRKNHWNLHLPKISRGPILECFALMTKGSDSFGPCKLRRNNSCEWEHLF